MRNRIRDVRKASSMTMAAFGEVVGITGSSVQRIEAGINNPSEQTIRAICSEFHVDRHWLETGEGEMYVIQQTPADLVARLASEHGYGPGGEALLRVCVRIFDELGPDALDRIIRDTIPAIKAEIAELNSGHDLARSRATPVDQAQRSEESV